MPKTIEKPKAVELPKITGNPVVINASVELGREKAFENEVFRMKQLAKGRYRKFARRKKEEGYSRKSFWLRLNKKEFDSLIFWLREQDVQDLRDLVYLLSSRDISSKDLLCLYYDHSQDNPLILPR